MHVPTDRGQRDRHRKPVAAAEGFFNRLWYPFAWIGPDLYLTAGMGDVDDAYRVPILSDGHIRKMPERLTAGTAQEVRATARLDNGKPQTIFAALNVNADVWVIALDPTGGTTRGQPVRLTSSPAMEFRVFFRSPIQASSAISAKRRRAPRNCASAICARRQRA